MVQRSSRFDLSTKLLSWWYNQKNKFIKNIRIQDFLARFPITSRVARKEGEAIFQLMMFSKFQMGMQQMKQLFYN